MPNLPPIPNIDPKNSEESLNTILTYLTDLHNSLAGNAIGLESPNSGEAVDNSTITVSSSNETVLGSITITQQEGFVLLLGSVRVILEDTESLTLTIRKTNVVGTIIGGPVTFTATSTDENLGLSVIGVDLEPATSQAYVLTGKITSGPDRTASNRRLRAINILTD